MFQILLQSTLVPVRVLTTFLRERTAMDASPYFLRIKPACWGLIPTAGGDHHPAAAWPSVENMVGLRHGFIDPQMHGNTMKTKAFTDFW